MTTDRDPTAAESRVVRWVPLPFWAWCVVVLTCTALYTATVPITSAVYELDLVLAFVIATVQCGSLILAVFRPRIGAALQLGAITALAVLTRDSDGEPWPLPVTGLISLGVLILLLGIRERWLVSATVWWSSVAVLVVVIALSPSRYAIPDQWGTNLTIYATYTATVLVAAIAIGQRRRIRSELAKAQRDVELEQAQRLYVEERARIARELHDVVAHSMSLIHMQALSAPIRLRGGDREAVEAEFGDIALSARTALGEMRQLLGALRSDDDGDADLAPQPQIDDIADLAESTSRAGLAVDLEIDALATSLSPIVQLTIYRLVQEALSNVVRHAPGAPTAVSITAEPGSILVSVRNDPSPRGGSAGAVSPDRGGQGLRGMAERIHLVGGDLDTRHRPDGGFVVEATIPVPIDPMRGTP
jgi:signal transduction histidine kinase